MGIKATKQFNAANVDINRLTLILAHALAFYKLEIDDHEPENGRYPDAEDYDNEAPSGTNWANNNAYVEKCTGRALPTLLENPEISELYEDAANALYEAASEDEDAPDISEMLPSRNKSIKAIFPKPKSTVRPQREASITLPTKDALAAIDAQIIKIRMLTANNIIASYIAYVERTKENPTEDSGDITDGPLKDTAENWGSIEFRMETGLIDGIPARTTLETLPDAFPEIFDGLKPKTTSLEQFKPQTTTKCTGDCEGCSKGNNEQQAEGQSPNPP